MKKLLIITLALIMVTVPALADFESDFNSYAPMYSLDQLIKVSAFGYKLTNVEIMITDDITLYSSEKDIPELLSAACCTLRSIDNEGSMIDQYGKLLHAYFMARSGGEKRSTTESGVIIYFSISDDLATVRLVK